MIILIKIINLINLFYFLVIDYAATNIHLINFISLTNYKIIFRANQNRILNQYFYLSYVLSQTSKFHYIIYFQVSILIQSHHCHYHNILYIHCNLKYLACNKLITK